MSVPHYIALSAFERDMENLDMLVLETVRKERRENGEKD
jgi:hypothetical protein